MYLLNGQICVLLWEDVDGCGQAPSTVRYLLWRWLVWRQPSHTHLFAPSRSKEHYLFCLSVAWFQTVSSARSDGERSFTASTTRKSRDVLMQRDLWIVL